MENNTIVTPAGNEEEIESNGGRTNDSVDNSQQEQGNQAEPFVVVNVNGVDVPYTEEQVKANLGKRFFAQHNKKEVMSLKNELAKYESLGLDDNLIQALKDAKEGNASAFEYLQKHLSPSVEDGDYQPRVENKPTEPYFLQEAKAVNPVGYTKYMQEINSDGKILYDEIVSGSPDHLLEDNLSGLYADIASGTYDKVMPVAMVLYGTGKAQSFYEAYVSAVEKINSAPTGQQNQDSGMQPNTTTPRGRQTNNQKDYSKLSPEERVKEVARAKEELRRKFG